MLTVVGANTRIFRTKITKIRVDFDHWAGDGVYFVLEFDQFRTYTSGADSENGVKAHAWDADFNFNYETAYSDFLAVKTFKIKFHSNEKYIGEAKCDLMTLACGPQDCVFTVRPSEDETIGKVTMNIKMEEVAETCIEIKSLTIHFLANKPKPDNMASTKINVETKGGGPENVRKSGPPTEAGTYSVTWKANSLEKNFLASTVTSIYGEAGLRVRLFQTGFCSETPFGYGLITINDLNADQLRLNPRSVKFMGMSFYDESGADVVGAMQGELSITHLPLYAQMLGGKNEDGIVSDGELMDHAKYLPPRVKSMKTTSSNNVKL